MLDGINSVDIQKEQVRLLNLCDQVDILARMIQEREGDHKEKGA